MCKCLISCLIIDFSYVKIQIKVRIKLNMQYNVCFPFISCKNILRDVAAYVF